MGAATGAVGGQSGTPDPHKGAPKVYTGPLSNSLGNAMEQEAKNQSRNNKRSRRVRGSGDDHDDDAKDDNSRDKRSRQLPEGCSWATKSSKIARGGHELVRLDRFRGHWNGREFTKIKTEYSKCACSYRCGMKTRTFCYCDFNLMLCAECYGEHIASVHNVN